MRLFSGDTELADSGCPDRKEGINKRIRDNFINLLFTNALLLQMNNIKKDVSSYPSFPYLYKSVNLFVPRGMYLRLPVLPILLYRLIFPCIHLVSSLSGS